MKCPVCGEDCVLEAHEIISLLPTIFSRCPDCRYHVIDKNSPPSDTGIKEPCACGKRFIDDIFVHIYRIMKDEGLLSGREPLSAVGMPLVHPGFFMKVPPFLPGDSLVLLSRTLDKKTAERIIKEVPEVRGVIKSGDFTPGVVDTGLDELPKTYELLAGCDIRANVFMTHNGPLVLYKQQSTTHIEFPRAFNPKIDAVEKNIRRTSPELFIDACCGTGTLGLTAARMKVPGIIMNDAWYAAAFFAAYNIKVNREFFNVESVTILEDYQQMQSHPVETAPRKIGETTGEQKIEVYQGDFRELSGVVPVGLSTLSVIDLFEKKDLPKVNAIMEQWSRHVPGEVFIP
jgi:hypothetical protein